MSDDDYFSRPARSLHGSIVDLHTALRRDEAFSKALSHDTMSSRLFPQDEFSGKEAK